MERVWEEGFYHLEKFVQQEGHARVLRSYKSPDGYRLNSWVGSQRKKKDKLTPLQISRLNKIGFEWDPNNSLWEKCFSYLDLDYKKYVKVDKKLIRPSRTSEVKGNISKAKKAFGYKPKTKLDDLIKIMMDSELKKYNG